MKKINTNNKKDSYTIGRGNSRIAPATAITNMFRHLSRWFWLEAWTETFGCDPQDWTGMWRGI